MWCSLVWCGVVFPRGVHGTVALRADDGSPRLNDLFPSLHRGMLEAAVAHWRRKLGFKAFWVMTFRPSTDFKASRNFIRPYEALDKALHRTILRLCSLLIQALKNLENPSWCQHEAPAILSECRHMTQTLHRKLSQRCLTYISQISLTYSCHQSFNHLFGQCLVPPLLALKEMIGYLLVVRSAVTGRKIKSFRVGDGHCLTSRRQLRSLLRKWAIKRWPGLLTGQLYKVWGNRKKELNVFVELLFYLGQYYH